jgi:hypothetical protein
MNLIRKKSSATIVYAGILIGCILVTISMWLSVSNNPYTFYEILILVESVIGSIVIGLLICGLIELIFRGDDYIL